MNDQPLQPMPPVWLDKVKAIAEEFDRDTIAIFILHGSEPRGLALSAWTSFEGEGAEWQAYALLTHAMQDEERPRVDYNPKGFDAYCEAHDIKPGEEPAAFAAYLNALTDGEWDGPMGELPMNGGQ